MCVGHVPLASMLALRARGGWVWGGQDKKNGEIARCAAFFFADACVVVRAPTALSSWTKKNVPKIPSRGLTKPWTSLLWSRFLTRLLLLSPPKRPPPQEEDPPPHPTDPPAPSAAPPPLPLRFLPVGGGGPQFTLSMVWKRALQRGHVFS